MTGRRAHPKMVACAACGCDFAQHHHETRYCSTRCLVMGKTDRSTDCWVWTGTRNRAGYGVVCIKRNRSAHRTAYEVFVGPIPSDLIVCHKCDNPPCVNPEHLFLGTQQDNATDSKNKGRRARLSGEECATSKLSEAQVIAIRKDPRGCERIARDYGITARNVRHIITRYTWRHIK